jgi:hypothetical protein
MASRNRDTSKHLNLVGVNLVDNAERVQADIGGHRVELLPGVKHRVVLNVRDVLKASGVLV